MTAVFDDWPAPARDLARAVQAAMLAAGAGDGEAFEAARTDLRRVDREPLGVVLGAVLHALLERVAPDGLDSETAELVLDRCVADARGWYPAVDQALLIRALTDGLNLGDAGDGPVMSDDEVQAHGLLLVADLSAATRTRPAHVIEAALRELQREQTIEMP